jgi:hypothetical protein
MALIDLYRVTSTLITLLTQNIKTRTDNVSVTALPPEKVGSAMHTLSLYLYHVAEDAYYKNALGLGSDIPNVAKTPMALNMFYILTVHHESGGDPEMEPSIQQNLMGYALKTFHDFPVITDDTWIGETQILDRELRGQDNVLQVILRPISPEDAITFWTTEEELATKLSAYYEVRVVMLEPEKPKTIPGVVLNIGSFLTQLGTPHLESSRSSVCFTLPQRYGGGEQEIESTPARVTLNASPDAPAAHNTLRLLGTNLTAGRSQALFLKNALWSRLIAEAGEPDSDVFVDPDLNSALGWQIAFRTNQVTVIMASTLQRTGSTLVLPVMPGVYTAFIRAVLDEKIINHELKQSTASSNVVTFAVVPRIESHEPVDADGNITINLGPEFNPFDAVIPHNSRDELIDIEVIVDGVVYTSVMEDPPLNPGEFTIHPTSITIKPHVDVQPAEATAYPFRLIVNGAESAPFWIEVP